MILLAVLALVVVNALAESPWGVFTVGATIPIALFMGCYLRFVRVGKVLEASAIGVTLLLLAVWGGKLVYQSPHWSQVFGLRDITLAWAHHWLRLISSSLPVWLLLAPRDYLSTFMKLGTIFALAVGILLVLPDLQMPALTPVRGRLRPGRRREGFPVLLHHHRLRGDFRLPLAHRQRHHAQDDHARKLCAAHRLRRDVSGIVRGHHGAHRRLHAGPGRLFQHERQRRSRRDRGQSQRARFSGDDRTR